jgi:hypothetical protein
LRHDQTSDDRQYKEMTRAQTGNTHVGRRKTVLGLGRALLAATLAVATVPTVSLAQQAAVPRQFPVTANVRGTPPAGAQHRIYVTCEDGNENFTEYTLIFPTSGTQVLNNVVPSLCSVGRADVPGYTSVQVAIDWTRNAGFFTWREGCCPTTTAPRVTVTTQPPVRVENPLRVEVVGVDFGEQLAGRDSAGRDAVIRNTGTASFNIASLEVAEPFSIRGGSCSNTPIAPKTDCTVLLVAKPPQPAPYDRFLRVAVVGSPGTPGAGFSTAAEGIVRVRGSDVEALSVGGASFGQVAVGAVSGVQAVSVVNAGSLAVRLSRITVPAPFRLVGGGSCAPDQSLTPNSSCTLSVVFAPTQAGDQVAGIEVVAISPSKDISGTGELKGTGTQVVGKLKVSPPAIDFGAVRVGVVSPRQTVTITNEGNAPIPITGIGFPSTIKATKKKAASTKFLLTLAGFTVNPGKCRAVLNPGASCAFTVVAKPPSRKAHAATLQVVGPGAQGTVALTVRGTLRGIAAKPGAIVIAPVPIGTQSAPSAPVAISNIGDEPVDIVTVIATGPLAGELLLAGNCTRANLPPAGQCTITVQATPKTAGIRKASIVITTKAKDRAVVAVQWSAATGVLVINPPTLNLGETLLGSTSATTPGNLQNTGKVAVVVTKFATADPAIKFTHNCVGKRLEPGQDCPFTVAATPKKAGAFIATLLASGSAGEGAARRFPYRGKAPTTTAPPTIVSVPTVPVTEPVATTAPPATDAPTTLPPLTPVLVMNPPSGEIGRPTTATGTGYPADVDVELRWPDGVLAGIVRTTSTGTFSKVIIAMQGRNLGPTIVTGVAVGDAGRGATASDPYLIKPSTFQPQSRRRKVVARN